MTLYPTPATAAPIQTIPRYREFVIDPVNDPFPEDARIASLFIALAVAATAPGRFRIYRDHQTKNADRARPIGEPARPGSGLLLEVVLDGAAAGAGWLHLSPMPLCAPLVPPAGVAYSWEPAGESIGIIQISFYELEPQWIASPMPS